MSAYARLVDLARQQIASARGGDVQAAIALLPARQSLLDSAPPPTAAEGGFVREVLMLDRELAGFIRERMLRIREEALRLHRGQTAMRGYGSYRRQPGDWLNAER